MKSSLCLIVSTFVKLFFDLKTCNHLLQIILIKNTSILFVDNYNGLLYNQTFELDKHTMQKKLNQLYNLLDKKFNWDE